MERKRAEQDTEQTLAGVESALIYVEWKQVAERLETHFCFQGDIIRIQVVRGIVWISCSCLSSKSFSFLISRFDCLFSSPVNCFSQLDALSYAKDAEANGTFGGVSYSQTQGTP